MGQFQQKWTTEQKDACVSAYIDRGVRPMQRVAELARTGRLTVASGEFLEPFPIPHGTVQSLIRDERKRRAGRTRRALATAPPRDAIEDLRRRLVAAADALLEHEEKKIQRKPETVNPERLRQITRCVREAQALPGPNDEPKPKPGQKVDGVRLNGQTRSGLAHDILTDAQGSTAPDDTTPTETPQGAAHHATRYGRRAQRSEHGDSTRLLP